MTGYRLFELYEICKEEAGLRKWLFSEALLGDFGGICEKCVKGTVGLRKDNSRAEGYVWRCGWKECGKNFEVRRGSWFKGSHLKLKQIVLLTYMWTYKLPQEFVQREVLIGSNTTQVDWYNFGREVCCEIMLLNPSQWWTRQNC